MKLSALPDWFKIERDHEFENLGFLSDSLQQKLVFLESSQHLSVLTRAAGVSCVLTTPELARRLPLVPGLAIAAAPRRTFFELHNHLARHTDFYGTDSATEIDPTAEIHPRAWVAEKNVRIGPYTVVEPHVTILERTSIGSHVRLRAGAVIGSIGFQLSRWDDRVLDMFHAGSVAIHDHVDVLANAVVARGVFRQSTGIGLHSRIGNLAFVSHNVQIGRRCFIGHHAVVSGNVTIGDDAWVGPNATIANNLDVGQRAQISLGATVLRSVAAGERVTGFVALKHRRVLRHMASIEHATAGADLRR